MNIHTLKNYTSVEAWEHHWQGIYRAHFFAARQRLDAVYNTHFANLKAVSKRHWQYRSDVPRDLLALPRSLWIQTTKLLPIGKHKLSAQAESKLSQKELAVLKIIEDELLHVNQLQELFSQHLLKHPSINKSELSELTATLRKLPPEQSEANLLKAINRLQIPQEGGREFVMFLAVGVLGRGVVDKAAFGSAAALGSAAATSVYISKQSFLAGLWLSWTGVPGWVSVIGAMGGLGSALLIAPLLSPLTEYGVNRWRAKKILAEIIDQTENRAAIAEKDLATFAGRVGIYAQLIPDLLQVIKHLR
ncbi:hypothetical protein [Sessilibacter sp. MAH4]